MRRLVLFMHVTLDGFVAGPNGEMDWIRVDDEIFDFAGHRTSEADTALYGRVTYQMMQSYWPTAGDQPGATRHDIEHAQWYNKVTKVVLSKSLQEPLPEKTQVIRDNAGKKVTALKRQPGKDILIFGSPSAVHSLIQEDLIDDYWLFINPVLLGQGIRLFEGIREQLPLKLIRSHLFSSGVICLHYSRH